MIEFLEILFDKKSPLGKAFRTAYQGLVSFLVHLPFILLIPEVRELLDTTPQWFILTVSAVAGVIAYFQNKRGV